MKKTLHIMIIALIFLGMSMIATAADISPDSAADRLYYYGFIEGTGNGLELDRSINRLEATVLMVRLLGIPASSGGSLDHIPEHTFSDVPEWANDYIRFGYDSNIIKGISESYFGSYEIMSEEQFLTLILRALEYEDEYGVFQWDNPWDISVKLGLIDDAPPIVSKNFDRGDACKIIYKALSKEKLIKRFPLFYYAGGIVPDSKLDEFNKEFTDDNLYEGKWHLMVHGEDLNYQTLAEREITMIDLSDIYYFDDPSYYIEVVSQDESIVSIVSGNGISNDTAFDAIYLLAEDVGKTGIRLELFDEHGEMLDFTFIYIDVIDEAQDPYGTIFNDYVPNFSSMARIVPTFVEISSDPLARSIYYYNKETLKNAYGERYYIDQYVNLLKEKGFNLVEEDISSENIFVRFKHSISIMLEIRITESTESEYFTIDIELLPWTA